MKGVCSRSPSSYIKSHFSSSFYLPDTCHAKGNGNVQWLIGNFFSTDPGGVIQLICCRQQRRMNSLWERFDSFPPHTPVNSRILNGPSSKFQSCVLSKPIPKLPSDQISDLPIVRQGLRPGTNLPDFSTIFFDFDALTSTAHLPPLHDQEWIQGSHVAATSLVTPRSRTIEWFIPGNRQQYPDLTSAFSEPQPFVFRVNISQKAPSYGSAVNAHQL